MKYIAIIILSIFIQLGAFAQKHTFNTHYKKMETGLRPVLVDSAIRTIEIKDHVIIVSNLFGCEYTSEYEIKERLDEYSFVVSYESEEVVVKYSPDEKLLVVTAGFGVKGQRQVHLYGEAILVDSKL